MVVPPQRTIPEGSDVLPTVRELFSQHPDALMHGTEIVVHVLQHRYLLHKVEETAVEAVLEALRDCDGSILP